MQVELKQDEVKSKERARRPYTPPAIIYSGRLTTRAGSPTPLQGDGEENAIDPADLFGNS